MRSAFRLAFAPIALALAAGCASAAGTGGCESFAWPLTTELAWIKSGAVEPVAADAKLAALPDKALSVSLKPQTEVKYIVAPEGKPKEAATAPYGALVEFPDVKKAGVHQVTLSSQGWIDVVQGGKALTAVAHTGKSDCDGVRKSVRFDIGPGPFFVQLSGVPADKITVVIRAASD